LLLRQELLPAALGVAAGSIASLAVNRVLQSQLVGVSPYDPLTLAATPAALMLVALIACWLPSRRAISVDPAIVLRSD
jgi:ABC-type lipoprotein release transport system permease subunit